MPLNDDRDVVRALGYVTIHSTWVEEDVDELLRVLQPLRPFDEAIRQQPIVRRLAHAAGLVRQLDAPELFGLPEALDHARQLFERRDAVIHGRLYAGHDKVDYIQSGRPNVPPRPIDSSELYALANAFGDCRDRFIGPVAFRLPGAVEEFVRRKHRPERRFPA
jgi:hypothetical protein